MKVTIFVEGGGDNEDTVTRCRQGFHSYCANAAPGRPQPRIVPRGGRQQAFHAFRIASDKKNLTNRCVLLVDSEGPVGLKGSIDYLNAREGWIFNQIKTESVFLMVQAMEAWFLADREALSAFYGNGFLAKSLPGSSANIEAVAKNDLEPALKHASKPTKTKGEYHKVKHGFALLALIDPRKVEKASPHAKLFNDFLRLL